SAAALITVVFLGQAGSPVVPLKTFGVGMVITILVDVTVIRLLIAPALMHLAGSSNWGCPPFLARLHAQYGLKGGGRRDAGKGNKMGVITAYCKGMTRCPNWVNR